MAMENIMSTLQTQNTNFEFKLFKIKVHKGEENVKELTCLHLKPLTMNIYLTE